jgi:tetratricopeptide (TPR) repeat protein
MEGLYLKYPDDLEVASFYALAHLGVGSIEKATEIAQKVLSKNPNHPGALHYYIHCNDHPERAHLALEAANRYPKVAPYAAHALHMPSHIFAALGQWDGVVSSNEQSMAAADDRIKRKGLGVDQRDYHSIWWLAFGYLQQGRYQDALALIKQVEGNASQSNDHTIRNNLTFMRAHYILESKDYNNELLQRPVKIEDLPIENQITAYFTDGYAAVQRGDLPTAKSALASMKVALNKTSNHHVEKESHNHDHGTTNASGTSPVKYSLAALLQKELQALVLLKEGKIKESEKHLQEAIHIQSHRPALSVPIFIKPAHELLGEVLLTLSWPVEAKKAFQASLKMAPNRVLSLEGLMKAAEHSGDKRLAVETQTSLRNIRRQEEAKANPENKTNKK